MSPSLSRSSGRLATHRGYSTSWRWPTCERRVSYPVPVGRDPSALAALSELAKEASGCTRCRLAAGRTNVVFATGNPEADLMFIGEGPGEQEDRQGLPFVGRSGQLLDRLILEEMGLTRENLYIANTIKC